MSAHLEQLLTFLRFPSVSADSRRQADVSACAAWLVAQLNDVGLAATLHPTPGHPIVLAHNERRPDRRTVIIYGHYDVQPPEPLDLWRSPPFEPVVREGIITARGATDNKGQIMAHICGVAEQLAGGGELPVNLIFLIEGEEEVGSEHLETFLAEHRDELRCDVVAISDTGMIAPGVPTFTYGLRGIAALELHVHGPSGDLHSGIYGGTIMNPVTAVARLVATLHDADGRIAVDGFYDDVAPLESWEREAWAKLPLTDADILRLTGAPALFGEPGYSSLERAWGRPTAEVNGIGGGYQGEGSKTVLPSDAFAKLTFRLVPGQRPDDIVQKLRRHFEKHAPRGITLRIDGGHYGQPYLMNAHSPEGEAAQRALQRTFNADVALIREGGSIPIVQTFRDILGVDTLLLGLALPDCGAHAPNETFPVANFEAGIRLNRALLEELGNMEH